MHASAARSQDETRLLQDTDMLGDCLERHIERLRELGHGLLRPRDTAQDGAACRMSEGPKDIVEVLISMVNHKVEYQDPVQLSTTQLTMGHAAFPSDARLQTALGPAGDRSCCRGPRDSRSLHATFRCSPRFRQEGLVRSRPR